MSIFRPKIYYPNYTVEPLDGYRTETNKGVGHYTAGPRDKTDKQALVLTSAVNDAHRNLDYGGIGYNYVLTYKGNIICARPVRYVGAHTYGENRDSVGVVCHGSTGDKPTWRQRRALRYLLARAHTNRFHPRFRTTRRLDSLPWYGHKDFNNTSCPGLFYRMYKSKGKKG